MEYLYPGRKPRALQYFSLRFTVFIVGKQKGLSPARSYKAHYPKAIINRKIHLSDKTVPFLVGQTTKSSQKLAMGVN